MNRLFQNTQLLFNYFYRMILMIIMMNFNIWFSIYFFRQHPTLTCSINVPIYWGGLVMLSPFIHLFIHACICLSSECVLLGVRPHYRLSSPSLSRLMWTHQTPRLSMQQHHWALTPLQQDWITGVRLFLEASLVLLAPESSVHVCARSGGAAITVTPLI